MQPRCLFTSLFLMIGLSAFGQAFTFQDQPYMGALTTVPSGGGPTVVASDNFNRADTTPDDLGTVAWVAGLTTGGYQIDGNAAMGHSGANCCALWVSDTFNDDQYCKATVVDVNTSTKYVGFVCRITGSGATLSGYEVVTDGSGTVSIARVDNTAETLLKGISDTVIVGDVIELRCSGTTIAFWKNGLLVDSATDATYASGTTGMKGYSVGKMDNWESGNL